MPSLYGMRLTGLELGVSDRGKGFLTGTGLRETTPYEGPPTALSSQGPSGTLAVSTEWRQSRPTQEAGTARPRRISAGSADDDAGSCEVLDPSPQGVGMSLALRRDAGSHEVGPRFFEANCAGEVNPGRRLDCFYSVVNAVAVKVPLDCDDLP